MTQGKDTRKWPVRSVLLVAAALVVTAGARTWLQHRPATPQQAAREVLLVPPGELIRKLDLGYHTLAASLLFLRANLYYGEHLMTDEQLPWLSDFVDILLTVDPDFKAAYLWASLVTLYFRREIDVMPPEVVARANQILEKGMRRFPEDHQFPMRIGSNIYYELGEPERALPYLQAAASLPGAPSSLQEKLVDIYSKQGQSNLARELMLQMLAGTESPELDQALRVRMSRLATREERAQFEAFHRRLQHEWKERFGALPYDLFLLVREPEGA
jgi:tetratricopeptide (TPR) repeat protein